MQARIYTRIHIYLSGCSALRVLAVELFVIARQQFTAIVKTSIGVTYLEMSHDNIASDIPPNAFRTPISMPELGAGPQQTQSTTCVCEGDQPSTPGHRDPPQSKKQKKLKLSFAEHPIVHLYS